VRKKRLAGNRSTVKQVGMYRPSLQEAQPAKNTDEEAKPKADKPMFVQVFVENDDGTIPRRAMVRSPNCRIAEQVDEEGYTDLMIVEDCQLQAQRRDGLLLTSSVIETVEYRPNGSTTIELLLAMEKIGGLGVNIQKMDDGVEVLRVMPGTPAEKMGIMRGDVIVEVDGIDVQELDINEFIEMLSGPVGSTVDFVFLDQAGEEVQVSLTRALLSR